MKTPINRIIMLVCMILLALSTVLISSCTADDDLGPDAGIRSPRRYQITPSLAGEYHEFIGFKEWDGVEDYREIHLSYKPGPRAWEKNGWAPADIFLFEDTLSYKRDWLFERLNEARGDTCFYYKNFSVGETNWLIAENTTYDMIFMEDFIKVEVKAITDYNSSHPAGSSLSEIAYLSYQSLYDYVQSGYVYNEYTKGNGCHPWMTSWFIPDSLYDPTVVHYDNGKHFYHFDSHRRLSEISPDNPLKMLSVHTFGLTFSEKPDQECEVELTVTAQIPLTEYPSKTYSTRIRVK